MPVPGQYAITADMACCAWLPNAQLDASAGALGACMQQTFTTLICSAAGPNAFAIVIVIVTVILPV